ncbi:MAG TPA: TonB-dependent receptor [Vicinamibacterales bacterium]|nr:TonB-dependent receptor [Vicinamibacterales bacterium]
MTRTFRSVLATFTVLLAVSVPAEVCAQALVGAIEGVVKDQTGAMLPGVTVELRSPALIEGARTDVTDANGSYRFLRLPVGTYAVKFSLVGFTAVERDRIVVNSGFTATINADMRIGSMEETLTVVGESPVVDVRTTTGQVVLSHEFVDALPSARTVFDMTKFLIGASTSRPDVGGTSTILYTPIQIHGSNANDRSYYRDGLRVAAYFGGGDAPRVYGAMGAQQEVNYQTSALPASVANGGVAINMVFKDGGNRFSGSIFASGGNKSMQSSNLDDTLRQQGVLATAGLQKAYDFDGSVGGPVRRDRAWFFWSQRVWSVNQLLANQFFLDGRQAFDFQRNEEYFGKVTWQLNRANKLSVSVAHDGWNRPYRRQGATFVTSEAALIDKDGQFPSPYNRVVSSRWTATRGNRWIFEAGWAHMRVGAGWEPRPEADRVARLDIVNNILSGAPNTIRGDATKREDFFVSTTRILDWKGTHELKIGTQNAIGSFREVRRLLSDMILRFSGNAPNSVDLANTPLDALTNVTEIGFYVQDSWTISNRLTLNAGLRYDKFRIDIAERSAPAGTWVAERHFNKIPNVPNWNDLVPRLGVSYDLRGNGRTVVKGSYSVYVGNEAVGVASSVNPMIYSTNRCTWTDTNGDLFAQASELSRCEGFSGSVTSRLDPDLKRQFNREYTIGLQHQLAGDIGVSAYFYRRENRNFRGPHNVLVPTSSYIPVTIVNPLNNQNLTIYDQDPGTLGRQDNLISNDPRLDNDYNGVELQVQRRFSNKASLLAGYHYGRAQGAILTSGPSTSRDLNDPNNFIYYQGAIGNDEPHQFKLSGSYLLPGDISASTVLLAYTGHPRQRNLVVGRALVPTLTRASQTVPLEPNDDQRYDSIKLLDLRFGRPVRWRGFHIEPFLDVYNVFNANTILADNTTLGPSLGRVSATINPRIFKVGAKFDF